jgi:Flp pilus assembly protein TadD
MRVLDVIFSFATRSFAEPAQYGARTAEVAPSPGMNEVERVLNEALEHYNSERFDDALAVLTRALEVQDDPSVRFTRASTYDAMGRYEEALADYNHILATYPDDPDTLNNRGNTFMNMGRFEEAWADYQRTLELRPGDPCTIYNLACWHTLRGDLEAALPYLAQSIEIDAKFREMAQTDPDLAALRGNREFRALVGLPPAH